MARIRSVHPGLFTDEAFVSASPLARLLFIGLWTEADDHGIFEWKPLTIKMRLLAGDNADAGVLLAELASANMVRRYAVGGRDFGAVRNFTSYQRPKKPKYAHVMTDEIRTYVGLADDSSPPVPHQPPTGPEPDDGDDGSSPPPIPQKAEISPQMEEEGGKREGEDEDHSPSLAGSAARKRARQRRSGIESDAQPTDEQRKVAAEARLTIEEFRHEWSAFRDHHRSKGNVFADWTAAWRQWVRRRREFSPRAGPAPRRSTNGFADLLMEHLHERDHDHTADVGPNSADAGNGNAYRDLSIEARANGATVFDGRVVGAD